MSSMPARPSSSSRAGRKDCVFPQDVGRSRCPEPSRGCAPHRAARDRRRCQLTALTAKAALVDPAALEDGDNVIATHVPRAEIEEALEAGTTSEFFLDVAREREGEREAEQRITVSWEPADLEKLLGSTTGDEVTFAFKADELARMFDEPDVEAQGLRERMAILTVAATTAAGISAGVAAAMPAISWVRAVEEAARRPHSSPTRPAAGPRPRPRRPPAVPPCRTVGPKPEPSRTSSRTRRVAGRRPRQRPAPSRISSPTRPAAAPGNRGRVGCVPHRRDQQRAAGRDRRGHGLEPGHRHDEQRRFPR